MTWETSISLTLSKALTPVELARPVAPAQWSLLYGYGGKMGAFLSHGSPIAGWFIMNKMLLKNG